MRRLEAAGYAHVGKTNLHEFAYGITSENPHYGTCRTRSRPAGSPAARAAATAAALAAGLAEAALGTDSGGSVRIPAACCGIVGFKPTQGLVPLDGCFPLAPSYDPAGPMARDVEACDAMMRALVPGFAADERRRSTTSASASRGQSSPTRSCASASRRPRRASRTARTLELPPPEDTYDETYLVHARGRRRSPRAVRRARRTRTATTSARRSRRASASRTPTPSARAGSAASCASGSSRRRDGVDVVADPDAPVRGASADADEIAFRRRLDQPDAIPSTCLGWPVLRPVRSRRGRPAGLGAARGGGRATTPSSSPAGAPSLVSRDCRARLESAETQGWHRPASSAAARQRCSLAHVGDSGSRRDEGRPPEPPRVPLRADEPATGTSIPSHAVVRVGSVARRARYEFQLSMSSTFRENGIV